MKQFNIFDCERSVCYNKNKITILRKTERSNNMNEGEEMYYALVWCDVLKRNVDVKGSKICRETSLPNDSSMLYGTNINDVYKIRKNIIHMKIKYDILTTKQSVSFFVEEIVHSIPRDLRIIVWRASEFINLEEDSYKIFSKKDFEHLVNYNFKIKETLVV